METIEFLKQYWGGLTFLLVLLLLLFKDYVFKLFVKAAKPNYGNVNFDKELNVLPSLQDEMDKANTQIKQIEADAKSLLDYEKKLNEYIQKQVNSVAERKRLLGVRMNEWQNYKRTIEKVRGGR